MATTRYSTSVSLCEDTSKNFELFDLLKQADPNYAAVDPARIKLYVYDGTKYVETTSGYFTAVDKDTFTVDASLLPNFNGELKVRVLGTDSTGNSFILDITIDVTPVNDAPSGADDSANVASGDVYVLGLDDFGFTDAVEGDAFKSVVITTLPTVGTLLLNGAAVTAGQEVLASDVAAGSLTYLAPSDAGGAIGFTFQVRDTGGTDGCGGNDLDLTPNTFTFNVPVPAKAVIGDTVWEDVNGNGLQEAGEAGIGGVTVQLRDPQGNLVQTTTTDNAGKYSFTVNPGSYFVTVVAPNGYAATEPDVGANDGVDSDIDGTGLSHLVTVAAGDINNTVDAGLYRTAQIGDRVWLDVNGNGLQDAGEAGVQGVQVRLLDANGNAVEGPITTDANGDYLFSGLKPGVYSIAFDPATLPAGYRFTTRDAGSDSADSDVNPADGSTIQTELVSGESDLSWDAGVVANPGSISGTVTEDQDNDNTGDAPIAGVTVELKDPAGNVVQTTTTDANGNYTFNNVPAGNYTVVETNKPGFSDVGDVDGGNPNSIAVTLAPGADSTGNDFVDERLPGVVSGTVLEDNNNDNVGDTPIPGVTVELKDPAGNVVQTTTTDANGNYTFNNVPEGNYTVVETNKPGYTDVGDTDGGNPNTIAVTVTPGSSSTGNVFVDERLPGAISGTVREDLDNNNSGDTPIAGVTVQLKDSTGTVVQTTTTDANGNYTFNNVPAGTYTVVETNKPGFSDVGDVDGGDPNVIAVTLTPGATSTGNDFVDERLPGVVSGTVLEDNNNDNVGDTPIPGVTVELKDPAGNVVQTTTTDANGNYTFNNVPEGNYTVVETNKPGYTDVGDTDGGNPNTIAVTVTPGSSSTGNVFVDERPATLGDRVWEDKNANGVQDAGEAGIANVTVQLKDTSGTVVSTTTTDANGNYSFSVTPGTYTVAVLKPAGYEITGQDLGGNEVTDSDINAAGVTAPVTLQSGQNNPNVDAGLYRNAELGDKVWYDTNKNGAQDAGEAGVQGVKVSLLDAAGNVVTTQTTDASGNYLFTNLKPGTYSVQFDKATLPMGYVFTSKDAAADGVDSDADTATGKTIQTVLDSGESDKTWDAGIVANPGSISGTVREDLDNNNSGDTPIAGVTVQLKDSTGTVVQTTTTDANGNYTFNNVPAGTYTVVETNKPGYLDVGDTDGGNPNSIAVTLTPGASSSGNDFVDERTAAIGDKVWLDKNANGVQDAGEAGIAGVTVKLLNSAGTVLTTTTTDASGNYLFSGLPAGSYKVQVVTPNGYVITTKDATVATDATDSDIDASGISGLYTLTGGANNLTVDAGFYKARASLGDKVWCDADKDGIQDAGEVGATGVTVKLLDANGTVVATTTTDANGNYKFSNLNPGDYAVQVVAPTGYVFSAKDQGTNDAVDSDVDTTTGKSALVTLSAGENDVSLDAGICVPTVVKGSIGDKVWQDMNYNGIQDTGEAGISGVTVKLLNSAGTVLATTVTNTSGNYLFSNLNAGDYKVQVVTPTGYYVTKQDQAGWNGTDSAVNSTGYSGIFSLAAGQSLLKLDAGLYRKASIGDKVWADWDHDDVQDAGEGVVKNVKVMLQNASGTTIATTYTDVNGNYKFTNLDPGTYRIAFDKTSGIHTSDGASVRYWSWADPNIGTNDSVDSDGVAATYTSVAYTAYTNLVSGEADMTWDAGITPIVLDLDGNGIQTIARENSGGKFDLLGTGKGIDSGWISAGDAFLAVDIDGDGKVTSVAELFGGYSKGDGFAKLENFDSNGDGYVDAKDAAFADLRVWQDLNGNHQTDDGELRSLSEAGVASLKVAFTELPAIDEQGNLHLERSSATLADGSSIDMTDVYFNVSVADAEAAGIELPSLSALLGDDRSLDEALGSSTVITVEVTATTATVTNCVSDGAVTAMSQLANLYDEQQLALMAA